MLALGNIMFYSNEGSFFVTVNLEKPPDPLPGPRYSPYVYEIKPSENAGFGYEIEWIREDRQPPLQPHFYLKSKTFTFPRRSPALLFGLFPVIWIRPCRQAPIGDTKGYSAADQHP